MARVLFAQPNLQPPGGGQAVAAHMLRALLSHGHDVTLLTQVPFDPVAIDGYFGTDLCLYAQHRMATVVVPSPWDGVAIAGRRIGLSLDLLRSAQLMRESRRRAADFDVVMSAHNEWPVPGPSVSYVHYPSRARPRPAADLRWFHLRAALVAYTRVADAYADFSSADVRRQHLMVNSAWTNDVLHRTHGVRGAVVPPIVALDDDAGAGPPWEQRQATFVCAGRFAPEKRHDDVIAIVRGVRARGHDVQLTFVGQGGPRAEAALRARAAREGFVEVRTGLDRAAYLACLRSARFGLHAMHDEHFGIAPAELMEAGCVTWGHNSGGVKDILGPALTYVDVDDAVARIDAALADAAHMERLRAEVRARQGQFGRARFEASFLAVVDAALAAR